MTQPVITVCMDTTVKELIALLSDKEISGVPVVDTNDHLVGVISITDLMLPHLEGINDGTVMGESDFHSSPAMDGMSNAHSFLEPDDSILEQHVKDLMSPNVITVSDQDHVSEVCDKMISRRIHRVVVVQDEKLCGIISVLDILQALRDRYLKVC
jgi:CBS domain-containing protein